MAFAYEIMRGRRGASGHCQETAGKTAVHGRGFNPGETCVLYALTREGAEKRDETQADGNGHVMLTGRSGHSFFVVSEGGVRLWQGGEDNYLRAAEWLKKERRKAREEQRAPAIIEPEEARKILAKDLEEIQTPPAKEEEKEEAESEAAEPMEQTATQETSKPESEPPYTLRPAGSGEPVDTLPE
ncbi:MAG: hypothetical protein IJI53_01590 [Clostridia bacterium]|nr:hypothetical protein [Clostridia bacterium]